MKSSETGADLRERLPTSSVVFQGQPPFLVVRVLNAPQDAVVPLCLRTWNVDAALTASRALSSELPRPLSIHPLTPIAAPSQ